MMKKKDYQEPTMRIVMLEHTKMLMASDGVKAERTGYGAAIEETWDDTSNSRRGNNVWNEEEEED